MSVHSIHRRLAVCGHNSPHVQPSCILGDVDHSLDITCPTHASFRQPDQRSLTQMNGGEEHALVAASTTGLRRDYEAPADYVHCLGDAQRVCSIHGSFSNLCPLGAVPLSMHIVATGQAFTMWSATRQRRCPTPRPLTTVEPLSRLWRWRFQKRGLLLLSLGHCVDLCGSRSSPTHDDSNDTPTHTLTARRRLGPMGYAVLGRRRRHKSRNMQRSRVVCVAPTLSQLPPPPLPPPSCRRSARATSCSWPRQRCSQPRWSTVRPGQRDTLGQRTRRRSSGHQAASRTCRSTSCGTMPA